MGFRERLFVEYFFRQQSRSVYDGGDADECATLFNGIQNPIIARQDLPQPTVADFRYDFTGIGECFQPPDLRENDADHLFS